MVERVVVEVVVCEAVAVEVEVDGVFCVVCVCVWKVVLDWCVDEEGRVDEERTMKGSGSG